VILYELLAGAPPLDARQFKRGAILEMLRMVREVDPPKPSTKVSTADDLPNIAATRDIEPAQLKRALRGDLDWIAMKALEKDRARRYETANGLAADVLRHLSHEPVVAAPPSGIYRLRKFVRKHRGAVIAASLVVVSLLGGLGAVLAVQARANRVLTAKNNDLDEANTHLREAILQKDEANTALSEANERVQARFELAREAIRSFKEGVEQEDALKEDRLRPLRDKLLGSARRFYDRLGDLLKGKIDAASKVELADSFMELAELIDEIGQRPDAQAAFKKAVAIRRELAEGPGAGAVERFKLGQALSALGFAAFELADHAGSLAAHEEAIALVEPVATGPGATFEARRTLGLAHESAGRVLEATGKIAEALASYRRACELAEALAAEHPEIPDYRRNLAVSHNCVGTTLEKTGDLAGALAEQRRYQEIFRALAAEYPAVHNYGRNLALSHSWVGHLLERTGDLAGALAEQRRYQELFRVLAAEHPAVSDYRRELAVSHNWVGHMLERTGDLAGALAEQRRYQELFRVLAAEHPAVPDYRRELGVSHSRVGRLLESTGDLAGALAEQWRNQEIFQALAAEHPGVPDYRRDLAVSHNGVGGLLTLVGRAAEALDELERARSLLEALARDAPNVPDNRDILATTLIYGGDALRDLGRSGEARDRLDRAVALAEAPPQAPFYRARLADSLRRLARLKQNAGDTAGADADARRAVTLFEGLPSRAGADWFALACARATLAAGRGGSGTSVAVASGLADQAMDDLRQAAATGRRSPAAYRYEPALVLLRGRDDFQLLMMDLVMPANPIADASAIR
jgi:eukaryotic-like serine/threonine-protein kinase